MAKTFQMRGGEDTRDHLIVQGIKEGALDVKCALEISNVHMRVELLNELDAWSVALSDATVVEETGSGALYELDWAESKLLRVVCPSTGHTYVLGAPEAARTVREALLFINRGVEGFNGIES